MNVHKGLSLLCYVNEISFTKHFMQVLLLDDILVQIYGNKHVYACLNNMSSGSFFYSVRQC